MRWSLSWVASSQFHCKNQENSIPVASVNMLTDIFLFCRQSSNVYAFQGKKLLLHILYPCSLCVVSYNVNHHHELWYILSFRHRNLNINVILWKTWYSQTFSGNISRWYRKWSFRKYTFNNYFDIIIRKFVFFSKILGSKKCENLSFFLSNSFI